MFEGAVTAVAGRTPPPTPGGEPVRRPKHWHTFAHDYLEDPAQAIGAAWELAKAGGKASLEIGSQLATEAATTASGEINKAVSSQSKNIDPTVFKTLEDGGKALTPVVEEGVRQASPYAQAALKAASKAGASALRQGELTDIAEMNNSNNAGWLRIDAKPVRQALSTWVTKWMFAYTQYLQTSVVTILDELQNFMRVNKEGLSKDVEPDDAEALLQAMTCIRDVRLRTEVIDKLDEPLRGKVALLRKYGLDYFVPLCRAVHRGDLNAFEEQLATHQQRFIRHGSYLLVERSKLIVYRNFFRRVALLHPDKSTKLDIKRFQACLKATNT